MTRPDLPSADPSSVKRVLVVIAVLAAVVLAAGTGLRVMKVRSLAAEARGMETPTVSVLQPSRGKGVALTLPGRLQAWDEAPVYARTGGYLRRWYVDIGDRVKAGQLLAEIDAPEVDQQLAAAQAALAASSAQLNLSEATAGRWQKLADRGLVSQQAVEEKTGDLASRRALRNQAAAEVQRLRTLTGFKRIMAPFDGVVTSRSADTGALVVSGATAQPLFTVTDDRKLRLAISLPENQANIPMGSVATFTVPDKPGKDFTAIVTASAGAVDPRSGTVAAQLMVDNSAGELRSGSYATVELATPKGQVNAIRVPASALLFRKEGAAVAIVDAAGKVAIRPIKIARDDGKNLAISSGLTGKEWVVDNPSSAISAGQSVHAVQSKPPAARPAADG
jgi:RND family efflux transporter MFP subunit